MSKTMTVAKKELWGYFSSPTAYIFLGTYLLVSMFIFFWIEKFFSRNLADLRPLFEWMPILLVFLVSTLTMKMWSEEHRAGTVEFLLTLPIKTHELVLGKFVACLALVNIGLFLTLGLAFTVGMLGPMDWGPVIAAYIASVLLAGAYISIGLFVSSRTDSQIVSLITTVVICSILYLLGSDAFVSLFGNKSGEVLRLVGSGSRFNAISRGILDLRDIYYYASITGVFLALNCYVLERIKWSETDRNSNHKVMSTVLALLTLNFVCANFWLLKVDGIRMDLTKDKMYSISDATKEIISELQEPLQIRGYFSAKTHPLLAPLVPSIRDFLKELQIVGNGKIKVEVVDPMEHPDIEAEANRKFNIKPVPFQVADRRSASMVSSYFNIVIQYGSQHEVMGFEELIEVKHNGMSDIAVKLRNLEYDVAVRTKKVMQAFKNNDNLFAALPKPVRFEGYISKDTLPEKLKPFLAEIEKSLEKYKADAKGKLEIEFKDPTKDQALANQIAENYGFKPQMLSLFSEKTFYFYLTLQSDSQIFGINPEDLTIESFNASMDSTLKRLVPGFLRTVGLVTPPNPGMNPMMGQFGGQQQGKQFQAITQKLGENYTTDVVDLNSGKVPSNVDVLLVLAPKTLNEKQLFAIDQFLMAGGSLILATSPVSVDISREGFELKEEKSGLEEWLAHNGIDIPKELVLDSQNSGFPEIRKRNIQGITINEPVIAPYPFFIDVRSDALNQDSPITSGLGQITMAWASPIKIDIERNKGRNVTELVKSSKKSWRSTEMNIESNRALYPKLGFKEEDKKEQSLLGVMVEGQFESFFKGKESPLLEKANPKEAKDAPKEEDKEEKTIVTGVIEKSSKIARITIFSSNEFIGDEILKISGMLNGTQYLNPLQIVENSLDWATEDRSLLSIRSRGHFARTLNPMSEGDKNFWEWLNYGLALAGLLLVYIGFQLLRSKEAKKYRELNLVKQN